VSDDLASGERFVPEIWGGEFIEAEHIARYSLGAQVAAGRRVLDAGCGVGWGSGWLLNAGARQVVGVDIAELAIDNARQRVPGARFARADLARLPLTSDTFDLVVCFEAIEHVADHETVLDELFRVLHPDGILMVSSPNPATYPPGNPFHVHELEPEELVRSLRSRFANVALWTQHTKLATVLSRHKSIGLRAAHPMVGHFVSQLELGSSPYSLVVASQAALPPLTPIIGCGRSEHEQLSPRDSFNQQRIAELLRQVSLHESARANLASQVVHRESDIEILRRQSEEWLPLRDRLLRDREHLASLLLESEQQLASALEAQYLDERVPSLGRRRTYSGAESHDPDTYSHMMSLRRELELVQGSVSWRITAPLRYVYGWIQRKRQ
jgi:ubiquinone/menaquinone biosynthesis C-methylase UbiE